MFVCAVFNATGLCGEPQCVGAVEFAARERDIFGEFAFVDTPFDIIRAVCAPIEYRAHLFRF